MNSNKLVNFFKEVYSKNAYLFIGINIFSLTIIFFVLSKEAGGSFLMRVFSFLFCVLVGGGLMALWARKSNESLVVPFRRGASILLIFFVGIAWMNDGYKSPYSSRINKNKSVSSQSYTCPHCNGLGGRTNNITGQFGECSSCGGDGRVTQEQYNRLTK